MNTDDLGVTEDIMRIEWRLRDTGKLDISGVSNAANYGPPTDPDFVDGLRKALPDFVWNRQYFDKTVEAWVTFDTDERNQP